MLFSKCLVVPVFHYLDPTTIINCISGPQSVLFLAIHPRIKATNALMHLAGYSSLRMCCSMSLYFPLTIPNCLHSPTLYPPPYPPPLLLELCLLLLCHLHHPLAQSQAQSQQPHLNYTHLSHLTKALLTSLIVTAPPLYHLQPPAQLIPIPLLQAPHHLLLLITIL